VGFTAEVAPRGASPVLDDAAVTASAVATGNGQETAHEGRPTVCERRAALLVIQEHLGLATLQRLQRTDNVSNVRYLAADWLAIAGAVATSVVLESALALAGAVLVIGSRQRALMNLLHQASHGQLFSSRMANRWCGRLLVAFPLAMSLDAYRRTHLVHHRHLWDEAHDPKTIRYAALGLVSAPRRVSRFAVRHLLGAMALLHVPFNVGTAVRAAGAPRSERAAQIAFWAVVATVFVLTGTARELLWYWALPYFTTFQVIRYWAESAEHAGLRSENVWLATRNWTSAAPVRWFLAPHSDSYHLAHHLVPSVPHYRLTELHVELMRIPEYAAGHQCDGFLIPRRPEAPSVVRDICRPDEVAGYRPVVAPVAHSS
jgi:fatty acid desaturase